MNFKAVLGIIGLSFCLFTSQASADFLIGVKAGLLDYDLSNPDPDPGVNGSVQLGYEFLNLGLADIAIEGEISRSIVDGEVSNNDISFKSTGVFTSLRTAGPVYFIGRVGYVDAELGLQNLDDKGVAMGIGLGFSAGIRWEIELTSYEIQNIDVEYLTFGISF